MKASELVALLQSKPDADVFIEDSNYTLHDIKVIEREDVFDGFDTVYEGGFNLCMKD